MVLGLVPVLARAVRAVWRLGQFPVAVLAVVPASVLVLPAGEQAE